MPNINYPLRRKRMIEIFHVSDLHFGRQTRKAMLLLRKIKEKFGIEEGGNQYLLITGDITQDGQKRQYKKALDALIPLKGNVRLVPGNHDYGFLGFVYSKKSAKHFDNILAEDLEIDHHYISKEPFSEIIKDRDGNKVLLVGLNSCSMTKTWLDIAKGDIGDSQRNSLIEILSDRAYKDIPKIIFLHHIPHRRAKGVGMSLKDYRKLMAIVRNKVDALTFGHEGSMKEPNRKEIRKRSLPIREMKLRRGTRQGIRYYLDANQSVKEQSCYRIKIEGNKVSARRVRLA